MRTTIIALVLSGVFLQANAATITIDFEDQLVGAGPVQALGYMIDGFGDSAEVEERSGDRLFVAAQDRDICGRGPCTYAAVLLQRIDKQSFAFYGADVRFDAGSNLEDGNGGIRGWKADDTAAQGAPGQGDWLNVVGVQVFADFYCFGFFGERTCSGAYAFATMDNIVVSATAVPVPAAAWLFGSGILALFGWRRTANPGG